jgi:hypothetical protein
MSSQRCKCASSGKQFLDLGVGRVDVVGIARERDPAKRSDAATEERPDVGRHESRKRERVAHAFVEGDLADVVAVVDRRNALRVKGEHRAHVFGHRGLRRAHDGLGIAAPHRGLLERPNAGR